eukprot:532247_1
MLDKLESHNIISELLAIKSNNWVIYCKLGYNQKYKTINLNTSIPLYEIREEDTCSSVNGDDNLQNLQNNSSYYTLTKCDNYSHQLNKFCSLGIGNEIIHMAQDMAYSYVLSFGEYFHAVAFDCFGYNLEQNQWYLWGENRNKQCLVYDNNTQSQYIKIPTKYHQRDTLKNESNLIF